MSADLIVCGTNNDREIPMQAAIDAKRVRKTRRRNGYAAHTWSSGETYEGEWKDGVMHGKGFYRYADDYRDENRARAMDHMHRYEGEFREGKFNGKGESLQ